MNMHWHNLIFSNQSQHRNRRIFYGMLLWWIYIVFTIFITPAPSPTSQVFDHHQPGLGQLGWPAYIGLVVIKSILLVVTHLLFSTFFTTVLLSNYFQKKRWAAFTGGFLLACLFMISIGYFFYTVLYPFIDTLFHLDAKPNKALAWASIDGGLINAIKLTLIMASISLLKRWWLRQKEKEKLEKEKMSAELQLLKAQIRPAFLFSTLDSIIEHSRSASPKAPEMLIKLSDLLSYMLYECEAAEVKLEKEIRMIKEFIALEQIRQGRRLEMVFQVKGKANGQMISPLLLLPFIDNSFSYCNDERLAQAWVNLDIVVEDHSLSMKLINGVPPGTPAETENNFALTSVQQRLEHLYPGKYELKINANEEMLVVNLNLKLV